MGRLSTLLALGLSLDAGAYALVVGPAGGRRTASPTMSASAGPPYQGPRSTPLSHHVRQRSWWKGRCGWVWRVVGFFGRPENPTFTLDENSCRAGWPGQMGPIDNYLLPTI